jgi:Amt family ammonium transporter
VSGTRRAKFRAIDFAGGTVVHITSGISALVCALVMGKRLGFGQEPMPPHNLTYTAIGAAMLWMGWFGFNGGSAVGANALAVSANGLDSLGGCGRVCWCGPGWSGFSAASRACWVPARERWPVWC